MVRFNSRRKQNQHCNTLETLVFLFQVRINAVIPLSIPPERRYYGDMTLYSHVYATLIDALKGTENVTEFCEFKYRDTLRQQVGVDAFT